MTPQTATALAEAASAGIAVGRLTSLCLAKRFPALLTWMAAIATANVVFALADYRSNLYFWCYLVLESARCLIGIVAVRELLTVVFRDYPGIRTGGRWVMYSAVALSLTISLALTRYLWSGSATGRHFSHLYYFQTGQHWVVSALAAVIVVILFFISKYPLHLSRNTRVSGFFFCILFLSEALQQLIDTMQPNLRIAAIDLTQTIFMAVCLLTWALLLHPEREITPARVSFSTPNEERLLAQLNALNQMMTRSARR